MNRVPRQRQFATSKVGVYALYRSLVFQKE
jgi:hypothetical protein